MINYTEVTKLLKTESKRWIRRVHKLPVESCKGHILAENIEAPENYPAFDKSAMDGFAIAEEGHSEYDLVGVIAAGQTHDYQLSSNQCFQIMTGASIPTNTIKVMRQEFCELNQNKMIIKNEDAENILRKGEDFNKGDKIISAGQKLNSAHAGLLAALGIIEVPVFESIHIGILSTGQELVKIDQAPNPSQVRNSNAVMLKSCVLDLNCKVSDYGIVPDDPTILEERLHHALEENDVVLITGGASKGKFDYVKPVCKRIGVEFVFEGVKMRPGKPVSYGSFGTRGVFVLPGSPVAALTCFLVLVKPFLQIHNKAKTIQLILADDLKPQKRNFTSFIPGRLNDNGQVVPVKFHGSGHIYALADAELLVKIDEDSEPKHKGDSVDCILLALSTGT